MATEKTARATWDGDLVHGSGHVKTESGSVDADMSWAARAEDVDGPSPEELIAAAHATCVSMALAAGLAREGTPPQRLETEATTSMHVVASCESAGRAVSACRARWSAMGPSAEPWRTVSSEPCQV